MRKALGATISAAIAAACIAPAASADTVTMGSTLAAADVGGVSGGANTVSAQIGFDPITSPNPVVSPGNGIITGWKVRSMDDDALYTLKVLHPNGPVATVTMVDTNFTAVSSIVAPSAVPAGTAVSFPNGQIFSYPASLPIGKGDYIGLLTGGADDGLPQAFANGLDRSLIANNFTAQPTDGSAANLLSDKQHDLLLQATVKFCKVPDLAGKTAADAQAALVAADCAAGAQTRKKLKLKKKTKKNRKKNKAIKALNGKVTSQTTAPGEFTVPGTAIAFEVGQLAKKKRKKK